MTLKITAAYVIQDITTNDKASPGYLKIPLLVKADQGQLKQD